MLPRLSRKTNDPNPYTPLESQLAGVGIALTAYLSWVAFTGAAGGGCSSSSLAGRRCLVSRQRDSYCRDCELQAFAMNSEYDRR
jgi:hypothetical protein